MIKGYSIRLENKDEQRKVENIIRESFWNVYRPGCSEHLVANRLRKDNNFINELNLIIEVNNQIIGQIMFMRASITCNNGTILPIITFGPFSIIPQYQKQGYGSVLLTYALNKAKELGYGAICIEGDYSYYSNHGFTFASNKGIGYHGVPEGTDLSFFLCKELKEGYLNGINGEYSTPIAYFVNDEDVNEFDKNFPYKEKKILPGQLG